MNKFLFFLFLLPLMWVRCTEDCVCTLEKATDKQATSIEENGLNIKNNIIASVTVAKKIGIKLDDSIDLNFKK